MFSEPTDLLLVPALLVIAFFVWGSFASFETLGWWAGWFGDKIYHDNIPGDGAVRTVRPGARSYVLFLSGIGRVSGHTLSFREQEFMRLLATMAPDAVIIDDIFPYSVNNLALTGQPFFAGLWRWSLNRKRHGPALAGYLINVRNLYQVGIAADKRYGPLYNQAMAEVILDTLLRYQYDPDSATPIYIVGYSGSAQMGVGAITYLRDWVKAPIYFISLGGIFSSDPGLLAADHVYHLWGDHDKAQLWRLLMIGRWPIAAWSEWNRALRHGRVTIYRMAGMGHTGRGGYIDTKTTGADGRSYAEQTAQVIVDIIEEHTTLVNLPGAQVRSDLAGVTA
jgi:hypothetical protein